MLRHYRLQLDLAPDFAARFDDVLAANPDVLVFRMTFFGTALASGGRFENHLITIFKFGVDGRVTTRTPTPRFVAFVTTLTLAASLTVRADDVSTSKMSIKNNVDPAKRQFQLSSTDLALTTAGFDTPSTNGASIHIYSATDDDCVTLPGGTDWNNRNGKWKYKNKATKNALFAKDGKLVVRVKSGVTFTLATTLAISSSAQRSVSSWRT